MPFDSIPPPGKSDLERAIADTGKHILTASHSYESNWRRAVAVGDRFIEGLMDDPLLRTDMFRLVDVLPVLKHPNDVASHVREYLLTPGRELPAMARAAFSAAGSKLTAGLAAKAIKHNVQEMAERFIAGQNVDEALEKLTAMRREHLAFTLDLLGEFTVSDKDADAYASACIDTIGRLSAACSQWQTDALLDDNAFGAMPKANLSIKLTALCPGLDSVDYHGSVQALTERVLPLLIEAKNKNVFVYIDLEKWDLHGISFGLFEKMAVHPELKNWPHFGIVVQAYLKESPNDVTRLVALSKSRGTPFGVRLVKGAYWDYETAIAKQRGWPSPVFEDKAQTDLNYEQLTQRLLQHTDLIYTAFGSHNIRSLSHALAFAQAHHVPHSAFEIQMLYGMADAEARAVRDMGYRVRLYSPVGELLPGMAYMARRLLENTANQGFVKLSRRADADASALLEKPTLGASVKIQSKPIQDLTSAFENTPLTDFQPHAASEAFARCLETVSAQLPMRVPIVVDGKARKSVTTFAHASPNDSNRICTVMDLATESDAEAAIAVAHAAWPDWNAQPIEKRAILLEKLADRLASHRFELAALQVWEVAKPWHEADADVAEAIDFCRFYARQALHEMAPRVLSELPGEKNILSYIGRGPTVVIGPWNFPLAILCGMATAALVAGNPVIIKPAEQASAVGFALFEHMRAVGFAADVVQFIPGKGETVGAYLTAHPLVANIAFTGSKDVGLEILETANKPKEKATVIKHVIAEMGGKNAIIVDADADLDEVIPAIVKSAFGFAGQKCSACSRVIVHADMYDATIARLIDATASQRMSAATDPGCHIAPVIDKAAMARLSAVIANPGHGVRVLYRGAPIADSKGANFLCVPPAVFEVTDPAHPLLQEEFFGPIVTVIKASNFQEAIHIANQSEYALTASVFSRLPSHLALAQQTLQVGNLYINRGTTGALVGRQPFGGFKLSGTGPKAGGPGYVQRFADMRCVTENTMRRGFAPDRT